jgi:hypothetical protein
MVRGFGHFEHPLRLLFARPERPDVSLVVAGINCLHLPLGTVLGVLPSSS